MLNIQIYKNIPIFAIAAFDRCQYVIIPNMEVYKFGGASLRDTEGVRTMKRIIHKSQSQVFVVVSAMGKTTNALEKTLDHYLAGNVNDCNLELNTLMQSHNKIARELLGHVPEGLSALFSELESLLSTPPGNDYNQAYDRIVPYGELFSSAIVHAYLNQEGRPCKLMDARLGIRTDRNWRNAGVDMQATGQHIRAFAESLDGCTGLTQGFIGGTASGESTTLGREGSDYSAAILAHALDAASLTVWKDVPGIMNADPALMPGACLLPRLSYRETIELAWHGAKVIHPKTIKPLENKNIPLFVKAFADPDARGTTISADNESDQKIPSFILKEQQLLFTFSPRDYSFISEGHIGEIFNFFSLHGIRANLTGTSALNLNVCVDKGKGLPGLILEKLEKNYRVLYNEDLRLISIRHYNEEAIRRAINKGRIIMQQQSRTMARFVVEGGQ